MKKFFLSKLILSFIVFSQLPAELQECDDEILLSYFPKPFVEQTLETFGIGAEKKAAIASELSEKDKEIIKTVEAKAAKMHPNPLQDPQQRQVAVKLFRETLYDSFAGVLQKHGITDSKKIDAMLEDVNKQRAKRFEKCMEILERESNEPFLP